MTRANQSAFIAVLSHRGGAMTSTIAAGLAWQLAVAGHETILADCTPAGGAWYLGASEATGDRMVSGWAGTKIKTRGHGSLSLTTVHTGALPSTREEAQLLANGFGLGQRPVVIADLPVSERAELEVVLLPSDLALLVLPSDGLALRSAVPFLQCVQEVRAMPGRAFRIKGVLTGTGIRTRERIELDTFAQRTLAPLLCGAQLPFDSAFRELICAARHPDGAPADSPVTSNLRLLAKEVQRIVGLSVEAAA